MTKNLIFLLIVLLSSSAFAKSPCADIRGKQSYPPLNITGGAVCFVQEAISDDKTGAPSGLDGISLYYISNGNVPVKANGRGLLYDETPGEIVDAFSMNVGRDHREEIFVIHSMDVRDSLVEPNSSGKFYSVSVFYPSGNTLLRDDHASDWFGADYSWLSDGKRVIYKFPYQSKKDVQQAIESPFALFMIDNGNIPVRVKSKSYLFEEPNVRSETKKYLIVGDQAAVEQITAGWCQVNYLGGTRPIKMWLMCSALDVEAQAKK
ncbi:hypothetical protein LJ656_07620 [Paraburkholderia sp. MMS20-SJTR3]|uniref:SH3 domain-containing protein n=1 Tax=Paraburkholderia sejongensis TaxID=2886946 RepID=A0ABS8JRC7_9BURK|nr:hypothetical protein [Paraburkholderia sp. MMS20-SJTR3]MCC8392453.1 hypothetical protein [Paraburkholderia sp. MMS20-SJTR3]